MLKEAKKIAPNDVLTPEAILGKFYEQIRRSQNARSGWDMPWTWRPKDLTDPACSVSGSGAGHEEPRQVFETGKALLGDLQVGVLERLPSWSILSGPVVDRRRGGFFASSEGRILPKAASALLLGHFVCPVSSAHCPTNSRVFRSLGAMSKAYPIHFLAFLGSPYCS